MADSFTEATNSMLAQSVRDGLDAASPWDRRIAREALTELLARLTASDTERCKLQLQNEACGKALVDAQARIKAFEYQVF